jgi:hypothetical protein
MTMAERSAHLNLEQLMVLAISLHSHAHTQHHKREQTLVQRRSMTSANRPCKEEE